MPHEYDHSLIFFQYLNCCAFLFKVSRGEMKTLYDIEFSYEEGAFSVCSEILLYADLVEGYANSVAKGKHAFCDKEKNELVERDIFKNKEFTTWFQNNADSYPALMSYLLMIDYIRGKLIDYFNK